MTISELKARINGKISKGDLVMAIFSQLKDDHIPKDPAFIYTAFYNLKKQYSDYFNEFIFDDSSIVPHSDELNDVLFRLEASSILPTNNPSYKVYDLSKKAYMRQAFDKFTEEARGDITEISKCLTEYIHQYIAC